MGSCDFVTESVGRTANEAFALAVEDAAYEHGHGGYTGTIAEKSEFVMIKLPAGRDAHEYAQELIDNNDDRIDDKWGPAGCIDMGPDPDTSKRPAPIHSTPPRPIAIRPKRRHRYLFFGWASS